MPLLKRKLNILKLILKINPLINLYNIFVLYMFQIVIQNQFLL